jgi:uncharacterized membrane protein HdeD (DUF308 family)
MNFKKKKENYNDYNESSVEVKKWNPLIYIFLSIVSFVAVYYSFIIEGGFSLGPFLLALIFSPMYIIWGIYKVGFPPSIKINR